MGKQKKVSYIRKPYAKKSFLSLGLALGALALGVLGISSAAITAGQAQLNVAAVCFCSMLISIFSLFYGVLSFFEKEKKYILSKIGIGISALLVIFWAVLLIIGIKG
ncbi:hypothetical protein LAD12857_44110 [Lacrimispora amygdalina]|uniref:Calcium:proton exchanger n=1 Tax=Lacrimispora amygdalina TaxID=253257 RepID=A0A3E2N941_9FIRM|nr:DUF6142 family protein [Clostridium indicum]RFZ77527.1 calcium:proton exchanger [Clostridium indicum]